MTLNDDQIKYLYDFVSSKYVRYEDVKYELVDHLGCLIEEMIEKDSSLTFEEALQKVYAEFPISGFASWVLQKEKSIKKYWYYKFSRDIKDNFFTPITVLYLSIIILVFSIISNFAYGFNIIILISFIILLVSNIYTIRKTKRLKIGRKLLVAQPIFNLMGVLGAGSAYIFVLLDPNSMIEPYHLNSSFTILATIFFSFIIIYSHLQATYLIKQLELYIDKYKVILA